MEHLLTGKRTIAQNAQISTPQPETGTLDASLNRNENEACIIPPIEFFVKVLWLQLPHNDLISLS